MRWLAALAALGAILLVSCGDDDEGSPPTTTPVSASASSSEPPAPTPIPDSAKTPPPDDVLERFILECIGAQSDPGLAASELATCEPVFPTKVLAQAVEGPLPVVLIDFVSAVESECFFAVSFLAWVDEARWHAQSAEPFLSDAKYPGGEPGTRFFGRVSSAQALESRVQFRTQVVDG
jgi:hypothetical protein